MSFGLCLFCMCSLSSFQVFVIQTEYCVPGLGGTWKLLDVFSDILHTCLHVKNLILSFFSSAAQFHYCYFLLLTGVFPYPYQRSSDRMLYICTDCKFAPLRKICDLWLLKWNYLDLTHFATFNHRRPSGGQQWLLNLFKRFNWYGQFCIHLFFTGTWSLIHVYIL